MNSKQIYFALIQNKVTRDKFDGIYSRDTLKDIFVRPKFIICNTDYSYNKGKHWVAFYFDKKGNVEFFDSLGKPLKHYGKEFVLFAKMFAKKIKKTEIRTQPKNSKLCGIYCLFFIYFRCKGYSFDKIVNYMKKPYTRIVKIVNKVFKVCPKSECTLLQQCMEN